MQIPPNHERIQNPYIVPRVSKTSKVKEKKKDIPLKKRKKKQHGEFTQSFDKEI
ncbi:hypothetical protein [Thermolongibacillus altinsuensis]|jgi:hypothetical protein|uniref:hypothetical protein n=1 Tax=Thermolongibacillus altinsuensis TaxID=575256 RepID=UPI00242A2FE6|nr:hypothetical protein [Thermolongibacillus altinsuensis]GMB08964.1 hypothetical protein B1no1_16740 [Thermolongibacillus altinsuensis]